MAFGILNSICIFPLLAEVNLSLVFLKYLEGMIPSRMQLRSTPESIKAITLNSKSLLMTILTLECHFWKLILLMVSKNFLLGLVPLNPIVRCYVCYYVWHYVWLNVMINKVSLLLSKIMVTWIFRHYHIVHEMHSMWFMWFSYRRYTSQVLCKLRILVCSRWWNWAFHLRRL